VRHVTTVEVKLLTYNDAKQVSDTTKMELVHGCEVAELEEEAEEESSREEEAPVRRRGKLRRKKRKCRRGSIYGQQTEVRDPPEPLETQVSQIIEGSRHESLGFIKLYQFFNPLIA
jgi:hypothetical protein